MADLRRCDTHGVVLTEAGTCVLCERRAPAKSGRTMVWLLTCTVALLLASALAFRTYRAVSDRRAAEADVRAKAAVATRAAPTTTVAPVPAAATTPATVEARDGEPRTDSSEAQREHERRVLDAQRSVQIDLYGEGWCPSCRKARAWLDSQGIAYTYRDTGDTVNKHTMRALNPNSTIPTIDIEGNVLVGFDARAMRASIRRAAETRVAKAGR